MSSATRPPGVEADAIPRSEFLAKLALGIGAIPVVGLLWGMVLGTVLLAGAIILAL